MSTQCFHCTQPIHGDAPFYVTIKDQPQPMCCSGCKAVCEMIRDSGLLHYYEFRTEAALRPDSIGDLVPKELRDELSFYDHPEIAKQFVSSQTEGDENLSRLSLIIDNIVCAACVWLIEHQIKQLPGVRKFDINYSTHRAYLEFNPDQVQLSKVLLAIYNLGYEATPYDEQTQQKKLKAERQTLFLEFGVAAIFSMQVMMFSFGLYFGHYDGISDGSRLILRWASFIMAIPCVTYSSWTFYKSAYYDLKNKRLTMNVNISLAIILGTLASIWNTIFNVGEIYFESVTMFGFLLLGARLIEMNARHKALMMTDHVLKLKPHIAERMLSNGQSELIAVNQINIGDVLRVKPGESIPTDGILLQETAWVDESLLTGESLPVEKQRHDEVIGGAINQEQSLLMKVTKVGGDTVFSQMTLMIERAMSEKPKFVKLADLVSTWFVLILIAACIGTYVAWLFVDDARAFEVMLSVLVVSCPCALALATPSAISTGNQVMIEKGLIGTRSGTIEALSQVTDIVFDKTGTLTEGNLTLVKTQLLTDRFSEDQLMLIARSLEASSNHPIASAFKKGHRDDVLLTVTDVDNIVGKGLEGYIDGVNYRIGRVDWFNASRDYDLDDGIWIALGSNEELLALYCLKDELKSDSIAVIESLKAAGYTLHILSGDRTETVQHMNQRLGINHALGDQTPEDKLAYVTALQQSGKIVAMLGDGINDAPVLAQADVSIAIGQGALLTQATADMILMHSTELTPLLDGIKVAKRTHKIIIQNLAWALLYNILLLPAAMMGFILPWMAALGMSLSSLLVIGNTLRIREGDKE
ncbi:cadmium-translocating P-type ATPase [Wohlfahrtiimonas chitiniclastica]|uniref:heavy metal translocating P-type ATPase n=1 Tax=Wohlfahrtiimonas chitiniclastica TaxID=400946 RepID=UPI001BCBDC6A|nr:heavy metal translocating P-type ATPase [Wohlfahrtiimonas chitiniclastica]MBS7826325.1 cadmium-translocating P-type ATPase [Wohlfahrtiimonas chitiniclastica]